MTWHRTTHPADKTEWNRINKILHEKIKEVKNETFKSYSSVISATSNIILYIRGGKTHEKTSCPCTTIRKKDGS